MNEKRKHFDIASIIKNTQVLSIPEVFDCFLYECEEPDKFQIVLDEIEEFSALLPNGIGILDLPNVYSGNKRTKIYGKASCSATEGHLILKKDEKDRKLFDNPDEAESLGFRPCSKCMPEAYSKWKQKTLGNENRRQESK